MQSVLDDRHILELIESLALDAGRRIMAICHEGFDAEKKVDCSPVTRADREAEDHGHHEQDQHGRERQGHP